MKYFFQTIVTGLLILFSSRSAQAANFTDILNFPSLGNSYTTVSYSASVSTGFFWEHDLRDFFKIADLGPVQISDAVLSVTYSQTNLDEKWSLEGIGSLISSSPAVTTQFVLSPEAVSQIENEGRLKVPVKEETSGIDSFRLFSSELKGKYDRLKSADTTVIPQSPEPLTGLLVSGGLGIGLIRRCFRSRASHIGGVF